MSDDKNPFEAMMAQMQDMAKAMNPSLESFSAKGGGDSKSIDEKFRKKSSKSPRIVPGSPL